MLAQNIDRKWSFTGLKTLIEKSVRGLTFDMFAAVRAVCGRP